MNPRRQNSAALDHSYTPQTDLPMDSATLRLKLGGATINLATALHQAQRQSYYGPRASSGSSRAPTQQALAHALEQSIEVMKRTFSQQINSRKSLGEKRLELIRNLRSPNTSLHSQLDQFEVEESILPIPNDDHQETRQSRMPAHTSDGKQKKHHVSKAGEKADIHGPLTVGKYTTESANTGLHVHKNLLSAVQGEPQLTVEAFKKSAYESAAAPAQYVGKSLVQSGPDHFASTVGTNSVILPLGVLTLKAGIKEVQHSNHELQSLRHATKILPNNSLKPTIQAQTIRLEKTREAIHETSNTKRIGMTAIASGLAISSKSLSTLALNISLGIKSAFMGKSFFALGEAAKYGPAAGAAAGLGLAGAFVFGPAGGLIAATLGTLFTIKTVKKLNQLKTDFELLKGDIKARSLAQPERAHPASEKLHNFLIQQGEKRISFFNRFSGWNKSFLVSSGLYASSAITKATVTGLAIAGITAAASNPIGLAIITAAAITATIGMGISSLGFFRGYGKQVRYSASTAADHEWVDRN
jgi:hypothetical protein